MANAYFATGGLEVRTGGLYTYTGLGKYGGGAVKMLGSIDLESYGIGSPYVTATEVGYLNGVTSNIQTQINSLGSSLSIVWDTTPQLGGNLDVNGKYLATSTSDIDIQLGSTSGSTAFNIRNSDGTVVCQIDDTGTLTGPSGGSDLTFSQGVDINITGTVGSYDVDFRDKDDNLFLKINSSGVMTLYDYVAVNEQAFLYDTALASDHTYTGDYVTGTVDQNTLGLTALLKKSSDGNFDMAGAGVVGSGPAIGAALETGTGTKKILVDGWMRDDSVFTFTVGSPLYLSTTLGGYVTTPPSGSGNVSQVVGLQWATGIAKIRPELATVVVA